MHPRVKKLTPASAYTDSTRPTGHYYFKGVQGGLRYWDAKKQSWRKAYLEDVKDWKRMNSPNPMNILYSTLTPTDIRDTNPWTDKDPRDLNWQSAIRRFFTGYDVTKYSEGRGLRKQNLAKQRAKQRQADLARLSAEYQKPDAFGPGPSEPRKVTYPTAAEMQANAPALNPVTQITVQLSEGEPQQAPIARQLPVKELPKPVPTSTYVSPVTQFTKNLDSLHTPAADYNSPTLKGAATLRRLERAKSPVTEAALGL